MRIILLACIPLVFCLPVPLKAATIRGLDIQVIDSITKEPVPGLVVYYELITARIKQCLGFPIFDPVYYSGRNREKQITDTDGFVRFKKRRRLFRLYERIYKESIEVNIDIVECADPIYKHRHDHEPYFLSGEEIFTPNDFYVAVEIETCDVGCEQQNTTKVIDGIPTDFFYFGESLSKPYDKIVIELRRK